SVVTAEGMVAENPQVKLGGIEMIPDRLVVESVADAMPLSQDSSIDVRLDYRWLDLRGEKQQMVVRAQTLLMSAMRAHLADHGFLEIHSPKLVGAASESGAEVFEVQYFDRKAYLAQSPQFYKQMAIAGGLERVFEVGPVFRAENSHTGRHATEFTGLDIEMAFIDSHEDVMRLEEALLAHAIGRVKEAYGDAIERLFGEPVVVPSLPFPRITLHALYEELASRYGYEIEDTERGDLTREAERLSRRFVMEEYGHELLFVTDFAASSRAFYHMREGKTALGFDLIWKGVEITTGAQREHRCEPLTAQAHERGLQADVAFYTEFFRYGCPPHGGFGLGLDRLTMLLLNIPIKEAMFVFRGPDRLTP
ncbi:MAG: aspartate--tRNA(Asn) ligase, partial [Christensenellales bacterium]